MRKRGLLLVAVVGIAAVAWLLYGPDDARDRSTDRTAPVAEAEARRAATESDDAPTAGRDDTAPRILRLRVEVDRGDATEVPITVRCGDRRLNARIPAGADRDLDVRDLLAGTAAMLEVGADHPDYLPEKATVAPAQADVVGDVVLRLRRAAVVYGEVRAADGAPWPKAWVALFPMRDGRPADELVGSARTGADGAYRMRAGVEGAHLLLVLEEDRLPAWAPVDLWTGVATEAPPLVLAPGAQVTGRVRVNGAAPEGQAIVRATPRVDGHPFCYGNALWVDGRVFPDEALGFAEPDGSYRIGGLAPGEYGLRVSDLPAAHEDLARQQAERPVAAPAANVDFDFAAAWLLVRIERLEVDATRYVLRVAGAETFGLSTTDPEPVRIAVVPDAEYRVELEIEGREPSRQTVRVPAAGGTVEVRAVPGAPLARATLVVTLRAGTIAPPAQAKFEFYDPEREAWATAERTVDGDGGRFRLDGLPVGRLRLFVTPTAPFWHNATAEVELHEGVPTHVTLEAVRGGGLRILARAAAGALLQARCEILDGQGRPVKVDFLSDRSFGPKFLMPGSPSDVRPALLPGRYTLTFTHEGYAPAMREVVVRLGERTDVEVTLQPNR